MAPPRRDKRAPVFVSFRAAFRDGGQRQGLRRDVIRRLSHAAKPHEAARLKQLPLTPDAGDGWHPNIGISGETPKPEGYSLDGKYAIDAATMSK